MKEKLIKYKSILIPLCIVAFQGLTYLLIKPFQHNIHMLSSTIDKSIPFINYSVFIYSSWYVLLFLVPYLLYKKDKNMLGKYIATYIICIIIADITFIIYPTGVIRPELSNDNIVNTLMNFIYLIDTPAINCLPSMHCAVSMLFILTIICSNKFSIKTKSWITVLSILIMLSTLTTKQHVLIDLITGNLLMTIIFLYVNNNKKLVNKTKKMLNI